MCLPLNAQILAHPERLFTLPTVEGGRCWVHRHRRKGLNVATMSQPVLWATRSPLVIRLIGTCRRTVAGNYYSDGPTLAMHLGQLDRKRAPDVIWLPLQVPKRIRSRCRPRWRPLPIVASAIGAIAGACWRAGRHAAAARQQWPGEVHDVLPVCAYRPRPITASSRATGFASLAAETYGVIFICARYCQRRGGWRPGGIARDDRRWLARRRRSSR